LAILDDRPPGQMPTKADDRRWQSLLIAPSWTGLRPLALPAVGGPAKTSSRTSASFEATLRPKFLLFLPQDQQFVQKFPDLADIS
jgi:hypothetical protein